MSILLTPDLMSGTCHCGQRPKGQTRRGTEALAVERPGTKALEARECGPCRKAGNVQRGSLTSEKQGCQREGKEEEKLCRASSLLVGGGLLPFLGARRGETHLRNTPRLWSPPKTPVGAGRDS